MKRFLSPLVFSVFLFPGCDKVEAPLQNYVAPEIPRRKVLLEDYTGHTCGNCPGAAEVALNLEHKYDGELVVMAVHAGHFADIKKPKYLVSYKTPEGNEWNTYFKIPGYPNGIINRKSYGGGLVTAYTNWSSAVDVAFKDPYILDLDIFPSYSEAGRLLDVSVKAKFHLAHSRNLKLSVMLTEDSIIGRQLDYRMDTVNDAQNRKNYVFMHMLRTSVNGTWGTALTEAAVSANDSLTVSFTDFAVDTAYKAKHLSVVAFAFDAETREVIEVEKVKMIPKDDSDF